MPDASSPTDLATTPPAGPLLHATLRVARLQPLIEAYAGLGLVELARGMVDMQTAQHWRQIDLVTQDVVELGPPGGAPLLRLIESPLARPRPTLSEHGWLALEILVREVDALLPRARAAGFEILGEAADAEPHTRTLQLVGPAGERLHLTQRDEAAEAPFELPLSAELAAAHDGLGPLFGAQMMVASREQAGQVCGLLEPLATQAGDMPLEGLSRALGRPSEQRWPVATLQWAGRCRLRINEVLSHQVAAPPHDDMPPHGLSWLTMRASGRAPGLYRVVPGVWLETVA